VSAPYATLLSMAVLVMCFWGLTTTRFKENAFQFVGIWGVIGATIAVFLPDHKTIEAFGLVNAILFALSEIQGREVLMRMGVLSFAIGNAVKIYKASHKHKPPVPPGGVDRRKHQVEPQLWPHVKGGSK
jgi:uncharacterized membrane protein